MDVSHERIQDPITRDVVATGRSARQGINADAVVRLGHGLTLLADGTVNDAHVKGEPAEVVLAPATQLRPSFHIEPLEPGSRVPNVARWLGRLGVRAAVTAGVAAEATVRFSGPYTPIGEAGVETQSYAVLDLGASVRLPPVGAVLDLELQNSLDAKYPEIRASGFINPGAPRTLRAALRFPEHT
jgi:hypothetical protein